MVEHSLFPRIEARAADSAIAESTVEPSGGFVQASEVSGRPGGSGANAATALVSTGSAVHMMGYVGGDEPGSRLRALLDTAGVDVRFVHILRGHTSEVVIAALVSEAADHWQTALNCQQQALEIRRRRRGRGDRRRRTRDRAGQPGGAARTRGVRHLPRDYSMALRQARRLGEAVDVMDRSLEVTWDSLGIEHEEYVSSLSIKGNILEAWKRFAEAGEAHHQALTILRKVMAHRPEREVRQTHVEILNDYAAYLLRDKPNLPEDALSQAIALLDEALTHAEQGAHGWQQVATNHAKALRRMGQLTVAEKAFRDLVAYCEEVYGDPSYELSVALRDHAGVLQELGSSGVRRGIPARTRGRRQSRPGLARRPRQPAGMVRPLCHGLRAITGRSEGLPASRGHSDDATESAGMRECQCRGVTLLVTYSDRRGLRRSPSSMRRSGLFQDLLTVA